MENDIAQYVKPLTAVQVKANVQLIQQVMAEVMLKDVHYGVIPGTQKPTLYKAGSEKILSTFRIAAYPKEIEDLSNYDEIRYRVKVHGVAMENDQALFGVGIGECSSNEEKYKWRRPVCDEEYNETPDDRKRMKWSKGFGDKPNYQQKQIRTNPSDVANTILKMAKKRAQIDMTLTATGASDVFDQDLEDLPEGLAGEVGEKKPPVKAPQKKADAAPAAGTQGVTVGISDVKQQTKKKDGTDMKSPLYIIKAGDAEYKTFSETLAKTAKEVLDAGLTATIEFTVDKYGNNLTAITKIEPTDREPGAEG
jgi:hypothetical protein